MLVSLDIETEKLDESKPWTLHNSRITCIGVWSPDYEAVFRPPFDDFRNYIRDNDLRFVGHNFKFDTKHLIYHLDVDLRDRWTEDTLLMAATCLDKVPEEYVRAYNERRKEENTKLPSGVSHREGKPNSLKVLAPYHLKVEPFWEDPANHDNDDYVLKDCEYTYRLYEMFKDKMRFDDTYSFYKDWLLPKAKMLVEVELTGIQLDTSKHESVKAKADKILEEKKAELDTLWGEAYEKYYERQKNILYLEYNEKALTACRKISKKRRPLAKAIKELPKIKERLKNTEKRYMNLLKKAKEKLPKELNLRSPAQLKWLLKDYLGYDIKYRAYDKDEKAYVDKEGTGVEVLERLKESHYDIEVFLEYRKYIKLVDGFLNKYPDYLDGDNILRCNFNPTGTRTGRLSSSEPNLQQVPSELHELFIARDGYELVTRDASNIEANLIAFYSKDPTLLGLIKNNIPFHANSANVMFSLGLSVEELKDKEAFKNKYPVEYSLAKTVGYALFYGARWRRIQQTGLKYGRKWSKMECVEMFDRFHLEYEEVFNFKNRLDLYATTNPITNYFGRKFKFAEEDIYMKAFNTFIQSTGSDIQLQAAEDIMAEFEQRHINARVLLLVHDELCIETHESETRFTEEIVNRHMTKFDFNPVQLKVEGQTARSWSK